MQLVASVHRHDNDVAQRINLHGVVTGDPGELVREVIGPGFLKEDIPVGHAQYLFEDLPSGSDETGYKDLAATMTALVEDTNAYSKRVGIVSFR